MSSAFVRDGDDNSLEDIPPSLTSLIVFLTRENNGIQIVERKRFQTSDGRTVHVMSNGLAYTSEPGGTWQIVADSST